MAHGNDLPGVHIEEENEVHAALWKACAGLMVEVPKSGEVVYYFPQGHIAMLEAITNQDSTEETPTYDLPSMILCRVVNVQLMAERYTDEPYDRITLCPESQENQPPSPEPGEPEPPRSIVHSFCKILTPSDVSTHGGFSVLRKHATECFPPLDMTQELPTQDLITTDLHGSEWRFKHIYRGQPRRHLLTTGWSTFVASKRLVAGDCIVFFRGGNGELRVGCRHLVRQDRSIPLSVLSSRNMHLGILASAAHAIMNKSIFVVYYKPRSSQFIIGLNKYLKGVNNEWYVGKRFNMRVETEDYSERRVTGTIIEVGDVSPHWSGSKWRCLKVRWDEQTTTQRLERVSPWEIEPLNTVVSENLLQPVRRGKRSLPTLTYEHLISAATPFWFRESIISNQVECTNKIINSESQVVRPSMRQKSENIPEPSFGAVGVPARKPEMMTECRLFGVNLKSNNSSSSNKKELQVINLASISPAGEIQEVPEVIVAGTSESSKYSTKKIEYLTSQMGKEEEHYSHTDKRTCTKVQMQGVAGGRAIDLSTLRGYDELIYVVERSFEIEGELKSGKNWKMIFINDEGDRMLVGNDPWLNFCKMAKRIFIYSNENSKEHAPNVI